MVRLQMLMLTEHRNAADIQAAMDAAKGLGLAPTGRGEVTFSVRASESEFRRLCGSANEPQVPRELREWVESVSVAPRHERF
jgi:hypothetical protein